MKLLVLSTWYPFPTDNGSRLRAFHLLKQLARRHSIHLIAGVQEDVAEAMTGGVPPELLAFCESVSSAPWKWYQPGRSGAPGAVRALLSPVPRSVLETANPALTALIAKGVQEHRPDLILVLQQGMDAYLPALPGNLPLVLEEIEVSGAERAIQKADSLPARLRHRLTHGKSAAYWSRRIKRYSAVTAVSEEEAEAVRRVIGGDHPPVHVIPNGVEITAFAERDPAAIVPGRMLYNGALTYSLNRDAVLWFVRDILPLIIKKLPEARLVVTGRYHESEVGELKASPYVHLTGFLPDLRPELARAAVCVVPLLAGGGTRLKILEAWGAGIPVISTRIGAVGLGAEAGEHLLLADNGTDFAAATLELLLSPERAAAVSAAARVRVREHFDWQTIGERLSGLLEQVKNG